MNPSEGRVPVSWDECADWLEWFGCEAVWNVNRGSTTILTSAGLRVRGEDGISLDVYRLLPPPGLVAAPESMDGGGWLGEGRHVPEGWEWRLNTRDGWCVATSSTRSKWIVQCRPPVRARDVVEVPLTRLVGRTIEGETGSVEGYRSSTEHGTEFWTRTTGLRPFPAGSLDLDTGRVRVYAEGDEK